MSNMYPNYFMIIFSIASENFLENTSKHFFKVIIADKLQKS